MKFVQPIRDPEIIRAIKKDLKSQKDIRNYLLFEIGINTGLRISDILQLRVKDLKKKYLYLIEVKTKKQKQFEMNPHVRKELLTYLEGRDDEEFVIKSRQGVNKPLKRSMTYKILRKIAKKYGLEQIGNHTLRKTYGYFFYQETHDIAMLQKIFNHSDPQFTLRYIGIIQDTINEATKRFRI
ncbi:tyrosine-type recombinase/integrase [Brevibacillus nitrificans]|uniref:tyrosine-type recombinase/integrase n=1 Tax=Brevibacillus nitrificans TaxID=651560 RepID=UPI002856981B|nr:tyrosine-type recombinase/integrase [Brevibacillus nitrificans]MDR7318898.1 integrase [Brevibacillus nitrificans]